LKDLPTLASACGTRSPAPRPTFRRPTCAMTPGRWIWWPG